MAITLVGETSAHSSIRFSEEIAVDGDYTYFRSGPTNYADHVLIADISDPANPSIVGDYDGVYQWNYGFAYNPVDEHCFLSSDNYDAVEEIETSIKSSPTQHDNLTDHTNLDSVRRMAVSNNFLFCAVRNTSRLTILDIADSLQLEGSVQDLTNLYQAFVVHVRDDGNYAFVTGSAYATSVNTTNKASPTVDDYVLTNWSCSYNALHGDYWMVSGGNPGGWQIIDVSDPSNLSIRCTVDEGTAVYRGAFITSNLGNIYLFMLVYGTVEVYDVTDWTNPVNVDSIPSIYARGLTIDGDLLYIPRFSSGADQKLQIYDISDYTREKQLTIGGVTLRNVTFN